MKFRDFLLNESETTEKVQSKTREELQKIVNRAIKEEARFNSDISILESKNKKIIQDLKDWYAKYNKYISFDRDKILYLPDFKYEETIKGFNPQAIKDLIEFIVNTVTEVDDDYIVRYANYAKTPNYIIKILNGMGINFGSKLVSVTTTYDLDTWRINYEFFLDLHRYLIKYCMDNTFPFIYLQEDNKRFKPYFDVDLRRTKLEDYFGVSFTDRPIVTDGNWIRIRNDMGFLVDCKGKKFL